MTPDSAPPVIAIDGPSASGKGTVAAAVARTLGFHHLDSGALYRLVGYQALRDGVPLTDEAALANIAARLDVAFSSGRVMLAGTDVSDAIRSEAAGAAASRLAVFPGVRAAMLDRQRAFRRPPGLVADGRDMGTVVFPDAALKIFLTASAEERARRRYKQLNEKGISANIADLLREIEQRDQRDTTRTVAPLRTAHDTVLLDTSSLSIAASVDAVLARWRSAPGAKT
jgi:cytidylate kinase